MQKAESPTASARELSVRRKLLYEWRAAVLVGKSWLTSGRRSKTLKPPTRAEGGAARVKELERLLGQVSAENRFF